jgi:hypothetical protein
VQVIGGAGHATHEEAEASDAFADVLSEFIADLDEG